MKNWIVLYEPSYKLKPYMHAKALNLYFHGLLRDFNGQVHHLLRDHINLISRLIRSRRNRKPGDETPDLLRVHADNTPRILKILCVADSIVA